MFTYRRLRLRITGTILLAALLLLNGISLLLTPATTFASSPNSLPLTFFAPTTKAVQPHTVVTNCTDAGLNTALAAGGTITFNCPSPYTINISSQKTINGTVSIDGTNNGHQMIIDGGNSYRVFNVSNTGNLTLNNIKIAHGNANSTTSYGGGIDNSGTLSLTYVFLESNVADGGGGGLYNHYGATASLNQAYFSFNSSSYGGGALFNDGNLTDIYSGGFSNNSSNSYGGAIFYNGGTTAFHYVTFEGNSAFYGGAIYTNNGAFTVTDSTAFTNNQAVSQGGAIYNGFSSTYMLRINKATFTGNKVTGYNSSAGYDSLGGAIYTYRTGDVYITETTFTSNSVKGGNGSSNYGGTAYGGAIAMSRSGSGSLTVTNSIFNMNSATGGDGSGNFGGDAYGGAIDAEYGAVSIISSTFSSNTASGGRGYNNGSGRGYGGAINEDTNFTYRISSSTFNSNIAQGADSYGHGAGGGYGGAIYNNNNALPIMTNSTLFGNKAIGGAGGSSYSGGDAYGGAVYNSGGGDSLTIINNTISQNSSTGGSSTVSTGISKGGGLYSGTGSGITISNTIISGNGLGKNCDGQINDGGYNLEYVYSTCGLSSVKNDQSGDPKLALLANNGGPTQTQALQTGSAAIDNANDAACAGPNVNNKDQRGFGRPFGAHCDIGAFEFIYPTITTSFTPGTINPGGTSVLSFVLTNASGVNITSASFTATIASQITLNSLPSGCGATVNVSSNVISVSGIGLATGSSCTISVNVTASALGTYFNNTSPLTSTQFGTVGVGTTTTLTVVTAPPPPVYTYNLPLLANNAATPLGQTTTFITFQNLSATDSANITVQYYGISTGNTGPTDTLSLPIKGQQAILPNIPSGSSYGGVVTSSQPLNLVVSEGLGAGGSAYNVAASTASTLYSPLALNGQYGFTTRIVVFNAASSGTALGSITFYDENGNASGTTQNFNINAHASQIFNQADPGSGLTGNHAYWAKINGASGTSLTAQVIEFGPNNFVATFNAIVPSQVASTLYAPATFNGQFGFVTGMAIANPNSTAATGTIKYYNAGGSVLLSQPIAIPANGVIGVYQPATGVNSTVTSAVISSDQSLIMTINEKGGGTVSGTYVGLASGSNNVALPVMANGYVGFVTGATVFNTGSSPAHLTFTYLNQAGVAVGTAQNITLPANASFLVYQGDTAQSLANGYFGTALIGSDQPLLVTTNALNTSNGLFYTYTEPSK